MLTFVRAVSLCTIFSPLLIITYGWLRKAIQLRSNAHCISPILADPKVRVQRRLLDAMYLPLFRMAGVWHKTLSINRDSFHQCLLNGFIGASTSRACQPANTSRLLRQRPFPGSFLSHSSLLCLCAGEIHAEIHHVAHRKRHFDSAGSAYVYNVYYIV